MRIITKHLLAGITALASLSASAAHLSDNLHFTARMNAEQETHAVTSDGEGVASFYLSDKMDSLCIDIAMYNLSGPVTGIHIHEAAAGMDGDVIVNLTDYITDGNRVRIALTDATLPNDLVAKMMMGMTYINAHTDANAAGEIRGQIGLESDWLIRSSLTTDAETHTVNAPGMPSGITTMVLAKNMSTIKYRVVLNDLTGAITGAHLHEAAAGMDGGVIVNLTDDVNGNTIMGEIDLSANPDLVAKIMAGNVYINVHTTANAAGEVRGQLMVDRNLTFDSWLSTDQENHTVTGAPNAKGLAWLSINSTMDSLWYDVLLDSLSGSVSASHIHSGSAGTDGGVVVALDAANGNWISGVITGTNLTDDLIRSLLRGENYINVHTAANAAGEVRGQVYKHARSGYTVVLDAEQETHNVDNAELAHGSGIVTVDRDRTNVHYMIVVNNLTGPVTMAHFHNAAMGMDGGVIYDISPSFNKTGTADGAFGYWTGTFNSTEDAKILAGEVYVNVHTDANAAGEVRGQVLMGGDCETIRVSVEDIDYSFENVSAYPNPTNGVYSIDFVSEEFATGTIQVRDITGKVVLTNEVSVNNGNNHINIALGDLQSGVYSVNIIVGKASALNLKVVKL